MDEQRGATGENGGEQGQRVLADLVGFIRRYVVVTEIQATALALWVLHTYAFDAAEVSPYLAITSAEKRSGKSRLLTVLGLLCRSPWCVIIPSEAVLFRKIERDKPTLLLDEVDAIFGRGRDYEPLRALLNAGNERGTVVPRCGGPHRDQLHDFSVYCPKALAGIGGVPDTVSDRSIAIRLRRRAATEPVDHFRRRLVGPEAARLAARAGSWAVANRSALLESEPNVPQGLDDRLADAWEPLLALADLAGGVWPIRARKAATELSGDDSGRDESKGVRLLEAIHAIFDGRAEPEIPTRDLLQLLAGDEESPWAEWWDTREKRPGKGAPRRLAGALQPYGIRSRSVTDAGGTSCKGYRREQFEDAFRRYVPAGGVRQSGESGESPKTTGIRGDVERADAAPFAGSPDPPEAHVLAASTDSPDASRDKARQATVEEEAEMQRLLRDHPDIAG